MKRMTCLLAAVLVSIAGSALAQTPPALMAGMVNDAGVVNTAVNPPAWCRIDEGPTLFQRDGTNPALITLPYLNYALTKGGAAPASQFILSGQARLNFSSASRGKLAFLYMPELSTDIRAPTFVGYSEIFDAAQRFLRVRFTIRFPSCDVPFDATYRF